VLSSSPRRVTNFYKIFTFAALDLQCSLLHAHFQKQIKLRMLITSRKHGVLQVDVSANGFARSEANNHGGQCPRQRSTGVDARAYMDLDFQNHLPEVFSVGQQSVSLGSTFHWKHLPYDWMQVAL
jgi:hypothetical protein